LSPLDSAIVAAYQAGMLWLGYRGLRLSTTSSDYLVAGRRLALPMYTACLAAATLGGASTIGGVKLGYQFGLSGAWLVLMIGAGVLALGLLLSSRIAGLGVFSISEMLGRRYGQRTRLLSALVMAAYLEMIAVVQVIAIGAIFSVVFDMPVPLAIAAGGMVVVVYTVMGGMWSVSLTDFAQFLIMTAGIFFILLPAGLVAVDGWSALLSRVPPAALEFDHIGYPRIASLFLLYFLGMLIGQDMWQRVFTARDARVAWRGTVMVGVYCMAYALATAVIGMVASVRLPELEDPQTAFAALSMEVLPPGLIGVVFAACLSALMSTASGPLLAVSTLLANDVRGSLARFSQTSSIAGAAGDHRLLGMTRRFAALAGVAAILLALGAGDLITALDIAYTLLSGSLFVPVMAGLFWRRASASAAWVSMLASLAATGAAMLAWGAGSGTPIMIGIGVSLVTLIGVSLSRPAPATG
jgi:SSS family solute:Na+ symporter